VECAGAVGDSPDRHAVTSESGNELSATFHALSSLDSHPHMHCRSKRPCLRSPPPNILRR
jgi:hypothetical protein